MSNFLALSVRFFRSFDHGLDQSLVLGISFCFYKAHQKRFFALQGVKCVKDDVRSSTSDSRQNLERRKQKDSISVALLTTFPVAIK